MIVQLLNNLLSKLRLRHFGKSEDGQALVLAALAMLVLIMMAGMGVDVGYLRYQKEQMQKAADAGAMAAASALAYNGEFVNAATNDTKANGFTANQIVIGGLCQPTGSSGICVAVNSPPKTPNDPFVGLAGYVEVIVARSQPTFFMKVAGWTSTTVSSHAVASTLANSSGCVFALDPNDDANTLVIDSGVNVAAPSCAMYVESSNTGGLSENGSGGLIGSYIGVVGTSFLGSKYGCEWTQGAACPQTSMAQFLDPFLSVPTPTVAPRCQNPQNNGTYYPAGTYCSPIVISDNRTYTFGPGVVTVKGGITVTGTPTNSPTLISNSGGVLFYLTGPNYTGINISANVKIQLNPQITGSQAGILFFQDRSLPPVGSLPSSFNGVGTTNGSGNNNYSGAFYFPTTQLKYAGRTNPSLANSVIIDAWQVEFTGNAQLNSGVLPNNLSPIKTAILAE